MSRGGKREGAGRKTTWASGRSIEDTTVIRVPKEFASKLLEIAHKLDAGESIDFVTNSSYDTVTQSNIIALPAQVIDSAVSTESVALQGEVIAESVTESKQVEIELVAESKSVQKELVTESKSVQKELVTESKNEINELVTNSVNESEDDQTSLVVHPKVEALSKITSAQMAERMGMSRSTLASHKNRKSSKKFLAFLEATDPEHITWCPIKENGKLFYVILEKETKS
jgi:hypothetical protein